jgi:hypothetical protein
MYNRMSFSIWFTNQSGDRGGVIYKESLLSTCLFVLTLNHHQVSNYYFGIFLLEYRRANI